MPTFTKKHTAATAAVGEARDRVARFLHAHSPDEVVFTYGTTSSLNLLAHSFGASLQSEDEILLSALEHHSNLVPWQRLAAQRGLVLRFVPMTNDGRIDMDRLDSELTHRCRLVAMTHCANVTGSADWSRQRAMWEQRSCSMGPNARRTAPWMFASLMSTSTHSPHTRPTVRQASASFGAGGNYSRQCRLS